MRTESFDHDPHWDGFNNRQRPAAWPEFTQDFGWSDTHHAGERQGEIGGVVQRTSTPAWYALDLEHPLALDRPIRLAGSFCVTAAHGGGVKFGLFNAASVRPGQRPLNSMRLELGGAKRTVLAHFRVTAPDNRAAGTLVPQGGQTKKDKKGAGVTAEGAKHRFSFEFDPAANGGRGEFRARIDDLPEGHFELSDELRRQHFSFTHLGLMNTLKSGSPMEVYFDDISLNGRTFTFDHDPGWHKHGNRDRVEEREPSGYQQYGFALTARAGGKTGEAGGLIWNRQKVPSYYAHRVGPFTLDDRLEASGTISLWVGGADSQAHLGFFEADSIRQGQGANILAAVITAPTRVGHWVRPLVASAKGERSVPRQGPVLAPDEKPHRWTLRDDPAAGKAGLLTVTLDDAGWFHSRFPPSSDSRGLNSITSGSSQGFQAVGQRSFTWMTCAIQRKRNRRADRLPSLRKRRDHLSHSTHRLGFISNTTTPIRWRSSGPWLFSSPPGTVRARCR